MMAKTTALNVPKQSKNAKKWGKNTPRQPKQTKTDQNISKQQLQLMVF
jgi:hypothetical protein